MSNKPTAWHIDGITISADWTDAVCEAMGLAIAADCPSGWYEGPWFDDDGNIQTGPPPCLLRLIELARRERS